MRTITLAFALSGVVLALAAASAQASVVVLDFENVAGTYPHPNSATIGGFYNGGTSSDGQTGTNYGIDFSSNALNICLNTTTVGCSNASRGGLGDPTSQLGALFFLSGGAATMNVAAGFDTGLSFFYAAVNVGGSVEVWDDLNGAGNLLATLVLPVTTSNCDPSYTAGFCPFVAAGVTFSGTAKSVNWGGVANQAVFDDVTLGSSDPGNGNRAPEPASLALVGAALSGLAIARRRRA